MSKPFLTKIFWNSFWEQNKHEQTEQTLPDKNILKYFLRSKQAWADWANPSGQKYSKIVSEVETKMDELSNAFRTKLKPLWTKSKIKNIVKLNLLKHAYLFFDTKRV